MIRISITVFFLVFTQYASAQVCKPDLVKPTTPLKRFVINDDGTVLDRRSKLMWKRCLEGQSGVRCEHGEALKMNWPNAAYHQVNVNRSGGYAGFKDWYLPDAEELETIVEGSCYEPAISLDLFPSSLSIAVWSRSPDRHNPDSAWGVDFYNGYPFFSKKSLEAGVRLVRNTKKKKKKKKSKKKKK